MGGAAICIEFTYGHDDRYMGMMRNDFHALYTMQLGGVIGGASQHEAWHTRLPIRAIRGRRQALTHRRLKSISPWR